METVYKNAKIILQETEGGELILTRAGKPLTCPHATRVVVPGQMAGTLNIIQSQCGTNCPLFDLSVSNEINISLRCSARKNFFNIDFSPFKKEAFIKK